MGFQVADLETFAQALAQGEGVSGVWLLSDTDGRSCTMIVAVKGFDDDAHSRRLAIRERIEAYAAEHDADMKESRLVFDYRLTVDEPDIGPLHIPSGAQRVAASL